MARLPLSAETGDISRVERFRWIVLEAAAGELMYRRFLRENRGSNGGLMEALASHSPILVQIEVIQPSEARGASSNSHRLPEVTAAGVAGAPYLRLSSCVNGSSISPL